MQLPRRRFLRLATGAAALPAISRIARAQAFPTRPVTMIVPLAAGGSADVVGRILAERMRMSLGQPVIIENITGADGSIGTGRAAHARADGYTIVIGIISTHVLNGAFYSLQYDLLKDFAPISPLALFPFVLFARNTMPAKDLNELVVWLRANPNKASAGFATAASHLLTAFFQKQTGTQVTAVPYRGSAPELQDLVAGQIDVAFQPPDGLSLLRAGNVKAYAVTSDTRMTIAPAIPTFAELGLPTLSFSAWFGLFAPAGTPRDIIGKLNAAAVEGLADPAVQSRISDLGIEVFPREQQTPQALGALVKADAEKWWPIIKESGIKMQ